MSIGTALAPLFTLMAATAAWLSSWTALQNLREVRQSKEAILAIAPGTDSVEITLRRNSGWRFKSGSGGEVIFVEAPLNEIQIVDQGGGPAANLTFKFEWLAPPPFSVPRELSDQLEIIRQGSGAEEAIWLRDKTRSPPRGGWAGGTIPISLAKTATLGIIGSGQSATVTVPSSLMYSYALFSLTDVEDYLQKQDRLDLAGKGKLEKPEGRRHRLRITAEYDTATGRRMRQGFEFESEVEFANDTKHMGEASVLDPTRLYVHYEVKLVHSSFPEEIGRKSGLSFPWQTR